MGPICPGLTFLGARFAEGRFGKGPIRPAPDTSLGSVYLSNVVPFSRSSYSKIVHPCVLTESFPGKRNIVTRCKATRFSKR